MSEHLTYPPLDESYHGIERRKKKPSSWFIHIVFSIAIICLVTFMALILYAWKNDQRVSYNEGMIDSRLRMELALRTEIQTLQAYVVSLQKTMIERGIRTPTPPKPTDFEALEKELQEDIVKRGKSAGKSNRANNRSNRPNNNGKDR